MNPTRRDLLAWSGGAIAGLILTPVPWKLLGDSAKWTQNWPWIPQPARGPVEVKQTACALCAKGCGIRVRMAAGAPVGLAGAATHPVSDGALCPLAFGAHQLNWHPQRLRQVLHRGHPASWQDAVAAFRKAVAEGPVAVVDGRPGRAASAVLEAFAKQHGSYHAVATREEQSLAPYAEWSGVPTAALGYDFANVSTLVSFGAPLLDGWGTPGSFARRWSRRQVRLIQIEPELSRTAACAWRWVAIRPGSDAALAAGIARTMPLEAAAQQSGLTPDAIEELTRTIVAEGPVLAMSADAQPAVAALNLALGGSVVQRREYAAPRVPLAGSHRGILIDSTVPWEYEPQASGEVFRFAAWSGGGSHADWLLPAPGFLEELTDVPSAPASAIATYALAAPLMKPGHPVSSAVEFVGASIEEAIRARCERISRDGAGRLYRPGEREPVALAGLKLEEELMAGAVWVDNPKNTKIVRCKLKNWPSEVGRSEARRSWTANWAPPVLPPLAAKLFQESNLRERPEGSLV